MRQKFVALKFGSFPTGGVLPNILGDYKDAVALSVASGLPEVATSSAGGQTELVAPRFCRYEEPAFCAPYCCRFTRCSAARPESIGPFGGSAAVVQVDTQRPGVVLAATSNALLFKSANDGHSWTRVPFLPELRARLHAFVVVPRTGCLPGGDSLMIHKILGYFSKRRRRQIVAFADSAGTQKHLVNSSLAPGRKGNCGRRRRWRVSKQG